MRYTEEFDYLRNYFPSVQTANFECIILRVLDIAAADDVFVRKDLLKTKYTFVDYSAAEKYNNWCNHYENCEYEKLSIKYRMSPP